MMRVLIVLILATAWAPDGLAQSLDIGGIDLRLGQDVPDALKALSAYRVEFSDQNKAWFVTQRKGEVVEQLGHFSATQNKISFILKAYAIGDDGDTPRIYTRAAKDVRQRGGNICTMREVEFADDQIDKIETRCGVYRLTYSFPWMLDGSQRVSAGISIAVGNRPY